MDIVTDYTTKYIDEPEEHVEGDHYGHEHEQGFGQGQGRHGQEKAGVLQEEIADAAGRVDEDHRTDAGRGPHGGRRSYGGPGGQGGELLYEGVSVWDDQYGPQGAQHDRRGAEAHPDGRIRRVRELPGRAAAEEAGGGAMGEALYRLPGKDGAGLAAVMGRERLKARVSRPGGDKLRRATTGARQKADYCSVHFLLN